MGRWSMKEHPIENGWGMPDLSPEARAVVRRVGSLLMREASEIQYSVVTSPADPATLFLVSSARRSDRSDVTTQIVMLDARVWETVKSSVDQAIAIMAAESFLNGGDDG